MKRLLLTALGTAAIVAGSQAQDTNLWSVASPSGGTMELTDGVFDSSTTTSMTNLSTYGISGQDWSAFAGRGWTLSFDVYVTADQLSNTNVNDDTISCQLLDGTNVLSSSGNLTLANASWWTADAWNKVIWTGNFPGGIAGAESLANVDFELVNNDKDTHDAGSNYELANISFVCNIPEYTVVHWEDNAPAGGNISLAATTETDVTGSDTGHGDIGAYASGSTGGQWSNYGSANYNLSQYAGLGWQLSFDVYITAAQLADPAIADDLAYYSVAGGGGGYTDVGEFNFVPDAWNTVTWFDTLSESADLSSVSARLLFNDELSHPAGDNLYLDNFKFATEDAPPLPTDTLWNDPNPSGAMFALVTNSFGEGIGEYESVTIGGNGYSNYGTYDNDWSAYAGQPYTFSFELYVDTAQAGDANVTDDSLFFQITTNGVGVSAGYTTVSNEMVAGEWSTVTYSSSFPSDPSLITNAYMRLVAFHKNTHPASGANYYARNFKFTAQTPAEVSDADKLWIDNAPSDGMVSGINDPFATGQGSIGMFKSAEGGTSFGVTDQYWAGYAGQDWALSFDIYVPELQFADATVKDDTISFSVAGVTGGSKDISSLVPGEWNTITWTGTFNADPDVMAFAECLLVNDSKGTDPVSGPNYFVDNFKLAAVLAVAEVPPEYADATMSIEFTAAEGYADGSIDGQNDWVSDKGWGVNTTTNIAGYVGAASFEGADSNMTLNEGLAAAVGDTIKMITTFKMNGNHTAPTGWKPMMRMGLSITDGGNNRGYDNSGTSEAQAHTMFQASNNTEDAYRLYGSGWGASGAPSTIAIDGNPDDIWEVTYVLTVGDSPADTSFMAYLTNLTLSVGDDYNGVRGPVGEDFYDALLHGEVYPYVETANLGFGITGATVLSIDLEYSDIVVSGYAAWVGQNGLVGAHGDEGADLDGDAMSNLGEYAFGGDPLDSGNIGVVPSLDGLSYKYSVFGDNGLTVKVMGTDDLANVPFAPIHTFSASSSGVLDEYTHDIDTSSDDKQFIKLQVERN